MYILCSKEYFYQCYSKDTKKFTLDFYAGSKDSEFHPQPNSFSKKISFFYENRIDNLFTHEIYLANEECVLVHVSDLNKNDLLDIFTSILHGEFIFNETKVTVYKFCEIKTFNKKITLKEIYKEGK